MKNQNKEMNKVRKAILSLVHIVETNIGVQYDSMVSALKSAQITTSILGIMTGLLIIILFKVW